MVRSGPARSMLLLWGIAVCHSALGQLTTTTEISLNIPLVWDINIQNDTWGLQVNCDDTASRTRRITVHKGSSITVEIQTAIKKYENWHELHTPSCLILYDDGSEIVLTMGQDDTVKHATLPRGSNACKIAPTHGIVLNKTTCDAKLLYNNLDVDAGNEIFVTGAKQDVVLEAKGEYNSVSLGNGVWQVMSPSENRHYNLGQSSIISLRECDDTPEFIIPLKTTPSTSTTSTTTTATTTITPATSTTTAATTTTTTTTSTTTTTASTTTTEITTPTTKPSTSTTTSAVTSTTPPPAKTTSSSSTIFSTTKSTPTTTSTIVTTQPPKDVRGGNEPQKSRGGPSAGAVTAIILAVCVCLGVVALLMHRRGLHRRMFNVASQDARQEGVEVQARMITTA